MEFMTNLSRPEEEKRFSFSQLSRSSGEVVDTALKGQVILQKNGKDRLALLPVEELNEMREMLERAQKQLMLMEREAFTLQTAPDEHIDSINSWVDEMLKDDPEYRADIAATRKAEKKEE